MKHLFNILPYNFFSILASGDKEIYSDILFLIYFMCEKKNSYTFIKDELIDIIEEYFIEHNNQDILESEEVYKNSRDKATYVFRRLKYCGWLDTEYGENQQIIVNLEDYAIAFLNTYINFNEDNSFELSSYVYGIYQNMKNFEIEKGYLTLVDIQQRGKNLINRLRSLNSNIKKYIKKITKLENVSEEKQLQQILELLLGEYKENVIDKAYYYMKTNDNPLKYKIEFLKLCELRREDVEKNILIEQIMNKDEISLEEAIIRYEELIDYLENIFDIAINLMAEIDRKNTKYLNVSIGRIKILLNNDSNVEGMLLNILKNVPLLSIDDLDFNMSSIKMLNTNSLFTSKKIKRVKNTNFLPEEQIGDEIDLLLKEQIDKSIKYSKNNIRKHIANLLELKGKVTSTDFNLADMEEYIKLLLIFIYSDEPDSMYKVTWGEEEKNGNILLSKFVIERKDENDK